MSRLLQFLAPFSKAGAPTQGVNERQTLTIDATGGDYTLAHGGDPSDPIAEGAAAAAVQAALEALAEIGNGNVSVAGSAGGPYTIEFIGALAGLPQNELVADDTNLTGGAGTAVVAQQTAGVRGDYRGCMPGQLLVDTSNRIIYQNTGTPGTPLWTEVGVV
jgi:hypothetical protein